MPAKNSTRLSKKIVDALPVGGLVWDSEVKGFGCRYQGGQKIYLLKARIQHRQRWLIIGPHGAPWTVETARQEARRLWGDVLNGVDIAGLRDTRKKAPTVRELAQRYLDEYAEAKKKPKSIVDDRGNLHNHVYPLLGERKVSEVSQEDIEAFKQAVKNGASSREADRSIKHCSRPVTGGAIAANRCLALLSKLFRLAEAWKLRPKDSNPVRGVLRYPERRRQRFLTNDELARTFAVIARHEAEGIASLYAVAAIRLFLYTGARLSEILSLKWANVDLQRGFLMLPDSKTGEKPVFLNGVACEVLRNLPRVKGNDYVIVGDRDGQHLVNIQKPWQRIRQEAGIDGTRIHDLRHTFASYAGANGASLLMIGQMLGHTDPKTTLRYAHLVPDPLKDVNEKVGQTLATLGSQFRCATGSRS